MAQSMFIYIILLDIYCQPSARMSAVDFVLIHGEIPEIGTTKFVGAELAVDTYSLRSPIL